MQLILCQKIVSRAAIWQWAVTTCWSGLQPFVAILQPCFVAAVWLPCAALPLCLKLLPYDICTGLITTRNQAGKKARFTFKTSYQWCGPWVWASASTGLLTSGNGRLSWEGRKSFFWENFLTTSTRFFLQRRWDNQKPEECNYDFI